MCEFLLERGKVGKSKFEKREEDKMVVAIELGQPASLAQLTSTLPRVNFDSCVWKFL
jgi:hypothetical protein